MALGFLTGLVSFVFGLTTVSSALRIFADLIRLLSQPSPCTADLSRPACPERGNAGRIFGETDNGESVALDRLHLPPSFGPLRSIRCVNTFLWPGWMYLSVERHGSVVLFGPMLCGLLRNNSRLPGAASAY